MYHVSERISRTMANIIKNWELNFWLAWLD
jgi:hypothetical protein